MPVSLKKRYTYKQLDHLFTRALFRNVGQPYPAETERECYERLNYVKQR